MTLPIKFALVLLLVLPFGLALTFWDELTRLYRVYALFEPQQIISNFRSMDQLMEVRVLQKASRPKPLLKKDLPLPLTYTFEGEVRSTEQFLEETWTTGLLIIQDQHILYERYNLGHKAQTPTISWSLAKSYVATLIGIALEDGAIRDLDQSMETYVPSLKGSGYEGVSIRDVLDMSAPIEFQEDYANPFSDINRLAYVLALHSPIDTFMQTLRRASSALPGFHYVSPNTQALAMVIRSATGKSFSDYFKEKLWDKLGAEHDAYWLLDREGTELVFGGFNATLRDYAKLGLLYLQRGEWEGERIVSEAWIDQSTNLSFVRHKPKIYPSLSSWGYGHHWWIPYASEGDFCAIGIYHQYIYVNPSYRTVIVKTSADPRYNIDGGLKELETIAMFRSIAAKIGKQQDLGHEQLRSPIKNRSL